MTFLVRDGQLTTIDRPATIAAPSVRFSDDLVQTYAVIFESQPQLRTVISFLARNIAQIGLHVYKRLSDTDRQRLTDHPLAQLIARPNPRTTRYRLFDSLMHDLGIYDNAFLAKSRDGNGKPQALRLPPQWVTPVGHEWLAPEFYRVRGSRGYIDLPVEAVVHFRGHNPHDTRWGFSAIETLRRVLAEELAAGAYREQLWRNGARFAGYLQRPVEAPRWDGGTKEKFRAEWRSQYTGGGAQVGGTPILEDGMTFHAAAVTPEQAQYLEARKLTREEVAAAYHIPPPMIGILDHATFSNITEQHKMLYQDTLGPWLTMIAQDIELQLLPDLDASGDVYVEFNLAEKLKGSFEEESQRLQAAVGAPWLTRNEARARQNLPQIDGGDDLVTPLNVLSGAQASPQDSAPKSKTAKVGIKARAAEHSDAVERMFREHFDRQHKAIVSKLGASKGNSWSNKADIGDVWDAERWDRELAADLFDVNTKVATTAGRAVMEHLGLDPDSYDRPRTDAYLRALAESVAKGVNATTRDAVAGALAEDNPRESVDQLFAGVMSARAAQAAVTTVTAMSGFGTDEAARQSGHNVQKTWTVRSSRPRKTHSAMSGQTVMVGELFSNGARWPGDSSLSADERAGCTCDLLVSVVED